MLFERKAKVGQKDRLCVECILVFQRNRFTESNPDQVKGAGGQRPRFCNPLRLEDGKGRVFFLSSIRSRIILFESWQFLRRQRHHDAENDSADTGIAQGLEKSRQTRLRGGANSPRPAFGNARDFSSVL